MYISNLELLSIVRTIIHFFLLACNFRKFLEMVDIFVHALYIADIKERSFSHGY